MEAKCSENRNWDFEKPPQFDFSDAKYELHLVGLPLMNFPWKSQEVWSDETKHRLDWNKAVCSHDRIRLFCLESQLSYSVWEGIKLLDMSMYVCLYIYVQEFIIYSQREYLAKFTVTIADVVLRERNIKNEFMEERRASLNVSFTIGNI